MLAACLSAAASAAPPRVSRRVAVIGGGSGGLAAARFLQRAGHRPVLFEAGASLGGVWAEAPTKDVVYQRLQTNLPTVVMQSPDLDFPAGTRSYVSKRELGAYIARYAAEFGGAAAARLGCVVTRVRLEGGGGAEARWRVEWTCGEEACSDVFDAVAVANGHYDKPYEPEVRGQREWLAADSARSVLHSRAYDDAEAFRGEAVLVVGGRSSGVDIARQLHGVAAWVYVLETKCAAPRTDAGLRVTHVPLGARLAADGRVYLGDEPVGGPAVQRLLLATGGGGW
ncbi:hypothetical protein AB1Y20_014024 [Prymnesium parvum]|uniref:Flavin-containing monooxygenase n=1 Tax=Prymnesium parvum TaxID=97485 RepID=A0AB34IEU6_PRYPA